MQYVYLPNLKTKHFFLFVDNFGFSESELEF
jgi:hypothetical protein